MYHSSRDAENESDYGRHRSRRNARYLSPLSGGPIHVIMKLWKMRRYYLGGGRPGIQTTLSSPYFEALASALSLFHPLDRDKLIEEQSSEC